MTSPTFATYRVASRRRVPRRLAMLKNHLLSSIGLALSGTQCVATRDRATPRTTIRCVVARVLPPRVISARGENMDGMATYPAKGRHAPVRLSTCEARPVLPEGLGQNPPGVHPAASAPRPSQRRLTSELAFSRPGSPRRSRESFESVALNPLGVAA